MTISIPLAQRSTCAALVITCSDFRFKSAERAFAEAAGLADDYDLIARPGAIRSLAQPRSPAMEHTLLEEIRLLWAIHAFQRIIALNHESCRAYDDIATPADERGVHTGHLRKARPVLEAQFAGTRAELFLATVTEGGITVIPVE